MRKIVINSQYGGFSLSDKARDLYCKKAGEDPNLLFDFNIPRDDPALVEIVEQLRDEANGLCANLKVVKIPEDVDWIVCEYDGIEWVAEKHRTWD
jgi:hypothetical protein